MDDNKFCRVCGFEYEEGANFTTIMKHIDEEHSND